MEDPFSPREKASKERTRPLSPTSSSNAVPMTSSLSAENLSAIVSPLPLPKKKKSSSTPLISPVSSSSTSSTSSSSSSSVASDIPPGPSTSSIVPSKSLTPEEEDEDDSDFSESVPLPPVSSIVKLREKPKDSKKKKLSIIEANHQRWSQEIDLKTTIVRLNIGGHKYTTTAKTLTQNGTAENFFTALLSNKFTPLLDDEGFYFIDRDGTYFRPILDYLRTGEWICPDNIPERLILREARFYSIEPHLYSTISDESFMERIALKKNEFHKTQLKKHKVELKALKKHVLNSFLQKIEKRETVESAVFLPSNEHITRMWKYWSETQYHKYDAAWRAVFRRQAVTTLQQFAAKHKDDIVLDSQIYDVLYSSSSPSEPSSSFSRGVLEAFLWYFKTKHSLTVIVNDYRLLTNVRWTDDGGHLEWQLEPHIGISEPEVRGFRFVWKAGGESSNFQNSGSYARRKMKL